MLHIKSRIFQKPELTDVRASVLLHVVVLLLTHSCKGQSDPPQTIVAMLGDDVVLPCHLGASVDASGATVEWTRPDLKPTSIYLRRDGGELLSEQHLSYKGRTSLSIGTLKCGDVSLKLSKVKLSDAGTYRCRVPTLKESVVVVAAGYVSSPDIEVSRTMLECRSGGWYPQPEVLWLDGEGKLLSAGPTETVRGPDDLYTVSSRLTVEKTLGNSFTCRVHQNHINQTRDTHIAVTDEFFEVPAGSAVRIIICSAVCFMSIAASVSIVWKCGTTAKKQIKVDKSVRGGAAEIEQLLMEGQRDGELTLTGKMKHLDLTKAKLDEELRRIDSELQHAEKINTTLMDQKKHLKNQRETLISLLQEVNTNIEKMKKKMKDKPKLQKEDKMLKRKQTKGDLEKTKKQHEELLKNTDTLLESTENMIIRMREETVKLETKKEQINKRLTETRRQIEETQRKIQLESEKEEENKKDPKHSKCDLQLKEEEKALTEGTSTCDKASPNV